MAAATKRPSLSELQAIAKTVRKSIITSTTIANSGHPTSSLSAADIAVALYFAVMRYDAKNPHWPQRDRFIMSKGHAAPLLYAVMAEAGYFSKDLLPTLRRIGSVLEGHPNMRRLPGVARRAPIPAPSGSDTPGVADRLEHRGDPQTHGP